MKIIILAISLNFISWYSYSQTIRSKEFQSSIEKASKFIEGLQTKFDIPGISICVGTGKKILWAQAFGKADLENNVPATVLSKFRLGSVSKCLTSIAVGKLYQEGKLLIDSPIQTYVPEFPLKKYPITIRQLAGHTAGIRHYREDDPQYPIRYKTVKDGLSIFEKDSLLFEPNTAYSYSTYGYTLISAAIEGVSKIDFLTYMRREVFSPLKMNNTVADYTDSIILNRVRFYDDYGQGLVNAMLVDNSYKWAGGGYLSTPSDLVKLGQELLKPSMLRPETVSLLLTPQHLKDGSQIICGITWRVGKDSKERRIVHHGGTIEGGRTFIILYPDQDIIIAICANKNVGGKIDIKEMEIVLELFLKSSKEANK